MTFDEWLESQKRPDAENRAAERGNAKTYSIFEAAFAHTARQAWNAAIQAAAARCADYASDAPTVEKSEAASECYNRVQALEQHHAGT